MGATRSEPHAARRVAEDAERQDPDKFRSGVFAVEGPTTGHGMRPPAMPVGSDAQSDFAEARIEGSRALAQGGRADRRPLPDARPARADFG